MSSYTITGQKTAMTVGELLKILKGLDPDLPLDCEMEEGVKVEFLSHYEKGCDDNEIAIVSLSGFDSAEVDD